MWPLRILVRCGSQRGLRGPANSAATASRIPTLVFLTFTHEVERLARALPHSPHPHHHLFHVPHIPDPSSLQDVVATLSKGNHTCMLASGSSNHDTGSSQPRTKKAVMMTASSGKFQTLPAVAPQCVAVAQSFESGCHSVLAMAVARGRPACVRACVRAISASC